ncbi:MAG: tetratricopeptide repeat protein [Planctomycetota bacterium]
MDTTAARVRRTGRSVALVLALAGCAAALAACGSGPSPKKRVQSRAATDALDNATALAGLGRAEDALAEFERAIELNPLLSDAYLGAGDQHLLLGNHEDALADYQTATEIEPEDPDARVKYGRVLQILGRIGQAIGAYLAALELEPSNVEANINLSVAYMQAEEPGLAVDYAERAVLLAPRDAAALINLGTIYAALDEHDDAVDQYQQAAELVDPIPAELLINLAESLRALRRDAEVVNVLSQLVRTHPSAIAWERLGSAQFRLRNYDEALVGFETALQYDEDHYPALNGLGVYLLNQYLWSDETNVAARDEGLKHLRRSLQLEHRQPPIRELLARFR